MRFSNLFELEATLPNGLHDAEILSISVDYKLRRAELLVRPLLASKESSLARIVFEQMKFIAIDPPDPARDFAGSSDLTVNLQQSTPELLPMLSRYQKELSSSTFYSFYADELNGFIHIASDTIEFTWHDHG